MKGIIGIGLAGGLLVAATYVTSHAGVVIPKAEHRELHSIVLFTGGTKAGEKITLDIQALQDGDWIQYIGVISCTCTEDEKDDGKGKVNHKCLKPGENALELHLFSQQVWNRQITQLVNADLEDTLFVASILKRE